jgi:hypothetical protein
MALVLKDRVKETTTTTGTGTITLAGAATGYQSFSAIGNANTTYYCIAGTSEWEVGIGTYTASGTTLSRDTILASSNSNNAVNFSAGTKDVFVVYPAGKSVYDGGFFNGTVGATTPNTGAFTTLSVNSNNISADNSLGFRNRIINGDMRIAQRGTAAVSTNGAFPVDRFQVFRSGGAATFTSQQSATAPSTFINSMIYTVGTGAAPNAGDFSGITQNMEGLNVGDIYWGTASAQPATVSFWVRSSVTGTFGLGLRNGVNNYSYIASYTISAANTWEFKSVTVPGPTAGTWTATNTIGISVFWDLGVGSTFSAAAGSWGAGNYIGLTSGTKLISTSGATFYLTGVQFEIGSVATPFERRPYGTELALCQRYYVVTTANARFFSGGTGHVVENAIYFPVTMRAEPTMTISSGGLRSNVLSGYPAVDPVGGGGYGARMQLASNSSGDCYTLREVITAAIEL